MTGTSRSRISPTAAPTADVTSVGTVATTSGAAGTSRGSATASRAQGEGPRAVGVRRSALAAGAGAVALAVATLVGCSAADVTGDLTLAADRGSAVPDQPSDGLTLVPTQDTTATVWSIEPAREPSAVMGDEGPGRSPAPGNGTAGPAGAGAPTGPEGQGGQGGTPPAGQGGTPPGGTTPKATSSPTTAAPALLLAGMKVSANAAQRPSRGGGSLAPTATGSLTGRTVVVDPGHNGTYVSSINTAQVAAGNGTTKACNTSGTESVLGQSEHAYTWDTAKRLVGLLRAEGATVLLTRTNDSGVGPCVDERAAIGNRGKADLLVSLHADGTSSGARGFHIITSSSMAGGAQTERLSYAFAQSLVPKIVAAGMPRSTYTGGSSGITVRTDIAGLNLSEIPGIMLESGNMRNAKDARLLLSAAFRQKLAAVLADGVVAELAG